MGFLQGPVTTIHRLGATPPPDPRSLAVVVPMAAREVRDEAALEVVATAATLDPERIVVPVRGPPRAVDRLTDRIEGVTERATVLWCNSPRVEALCAAHDIPQDGKGSDVWLALGPAAAAADVVCTLDADVSTLSPAAMRRLAAPVEGPIRATKAYYTRVEDGRLYGRLCRLLVRPLVLALADRHPHPFVDFLRSFRYPLSGEMALDSRLVDDLRVPAGMGLELGVLGELYRLAGPEGSAQVDLGEHRHTHRPVTGEGGLAEIAPQVVGALADTVAEHTGSTVDDTLVADYRSWAARLVDGHGRDARINGLAYDAETELAQVDRYRTAVADPAVVEWLPAWSTVDLSPNAVLEAGRACGVAAGEHRRSG